MGIIVEAGCEWKKVCAKCREEIRLIATGTDICRCPYCGASLMDHKATPEDLELSLNKVHQLIVKLRNTKNDKEDLRFKLRNEIDWLAADLDFLEGGE